MRYLYDYDEINVCTHKWEIDNDKFYKLIIINRIDRKKILVIKKKKLIIYNKLEIY